MDKDIMVSIVCNTYNHEAYIEKALKGFVEQKTQYKFEVLLHDDASTDNTVKIIQKYEKLYPDLIKPIYQKYNQYSVDPNRIVEIQWPRITGKYVAFCEGDDYWIDCYKPFAKAILDKAEELCSGGELSQKVIDALRAAYDKFDVIFSEKVDEACLIHGDLNIANIILSWKSR